MVARFLSYRSIQFSLSIFIILVAAFCIFTPNYFLFKWGANFAVQIMLGYLILGLAFLFSGQSNLMFTSFACCAGLCLFLKGSSNPDLMPPARTDEAAVSVAHFNLASTAEDYESTIELILKTDADLISFQELTPDWSSFLKESLKKNYPYNSQLVRIDPFGLGLFSKYPFAELDTLYVEGKPNLVAGIQPEGRSEIVRVLSFHTSPPFNGKAYQKLQEHFQIISDYIKSKADPFIVAGDYNAVPWSVEIQRFREAAALNDSRRGVMPSFPNGDFTLFHVPVDHIFYSKHFNCIAFEDISSTRANHLGIQGSYQFNVEEKDAKKTIQ